MKLLRKNDLIAVAVVLFACALLLIPSLKKNDKLIATVTVDGEQIRIIDLSAVENEYSFSTNTVPNAEITVQKNTIYFSCAECPDKLCVKTGKLDRNGQTAACLPAKAVISLKSEKPDFDVLTY